MSDARSDLPAMRSWMLVHKWSSLLCTLSILLSCVTGIPLIFHEEIDTLTGHMPHIDAAAPHDPDATLDRAVATGLANRPGEVMQLLVFEDQPRLGRLVTAPKLDSHPFDAFNQPFDIGTGALLHVATRTEGLMWTMLRLHTDLYAGVAGTLFIGTMGLSLLLSLVSGVVVYKPFMRRLAFGTVRTGRSQRTKWLDLHNLIGIAIAGWMLVVVVTGVINTLAAPVLSSWQSGQLAEMVAPYKDAAPLTDLGSVDTAVRTAQAAAPDMVPFIVAFPGTMFSSQHHYAVFMRGNSPLTANLLKPALIDATTGELTDMREMPWHVRGLFIAQPLHFGDYGGLIMQFAWGAMGLLTILVLFSGLILWRRPTRAAESAQ